MLFSNPHPKLSYKIAGAQSFTYVIKVTISFYDKREHVVMLAKFFFDISAPRILAPM